MIPKNFGIKKIITFQNPDWFTNRIEKQLKLHLVSEISTGRIGNSDYHQTLR